MGAATASTTSGTAVATSVFGPTITGMGVSSLATAAMIHVGATVLDHLPHGSFFHATGGSINMEDDNLLHFSNIIKETVGKEVAYTEGAGAAGGLGAALLSFLNGELKKGIDLIINHTELKEKIKNADFLFTGEGSIDSQTIYGKTPMGVAKVAKEQGVKNIAFAGKVGGGVENLYRIGINSIFSIMRGVSSLEDALRDGKENLELTVENLVRIIK